VEIKPSGQQLEMGEVALTNSSAKDANAWGARLSHLYGRSFIAECKEYL